MSGIEILGIAASVLQIADLGGRLSVKLFTFAKSVKSADKKIDLVSRDIAATGAVLLQLGRELEKDDSVKFCNKEAIETAQSLVEECNSLFSDLNGAIEGKAAGNQRFRFIDGLKRRAKWPFLEPHVELLRTNLERLKSSLVFLVNVMIFAEQVRNHETVPLLKSQKELLQQLLDDKNRAEGDFEHAVKSIEGVDRTGLVEVDSVLTHEDGEDETDRNAVQSPVQQLFAQTGETRDTTVQGERAAVEEDVVNTSSSREIRDFSTDTSGSTSPAKEMAQKTRPLVSKWKDVDTKKPLQKFLEMYKDELLSHVRLTQKLVEEIASVEYTLSHRGKADLEDAVMLAYWEYNKRYMGISMNEMENLLSEELDLGEGDAKLVKFWTKLWNAEDLRNSPDRQQERERHFESRVRANFGAAGYSPEHIDQILNGKADPKTAIDLSRPTYIKVHKRYLSPRTLDHYGLPWEWYTEDPNYLIIKQYIGVELQEELFEHTKNLKERKEVVLEDEGETVVTLKPHDVTKNQDQMFLVRKKTPNSTAPELGSQELDELLLKYSTLTKEEVDDLNTQMGQDNAGGAREAGFLFT